MLALRLCLLHLHFVPASASLASASLALVPASLVLFAVMFFAAMPPASCFTFFMGCTAISCA